jgi:antitoxin component YwqK of YwqJK toxin-antitoxin module
MSYLVKGKTEIVYDCSIGPKGIFEVYSSAGQLVRQAYYSRGVMHGLSSTWQGGVLRSQYNYRSNELHGTSGEWNERGILINECNYENDYSYGESRSWTDDGVLSKVENYVNGVRNGIQHSYHRNGKISEESIVSNGMLVGKVKTFYESGEPFEIYEVDECKQGEYRMFHENGQLKIQCEYNKDELDGEYKEWDEEGNLVLERFYVEGKLASI